MANMHLVTGYAGEPHVTAQDQASLQAGFYESDVVVLNRNEKFGISIQNNNTVRIGSGDAIFQGRHVRIPAGQYVDLTIDNGTAGKNRVDVVAIRYTRNASTNEEECNLVVIKGNPSSTRPIAPSVTKGDMLDDTAVLAEAALYQVTLNGIEIQGITRAFYIAPSIVGHFDNRNNPHDVTAAQVGAVTANHTHVVVGSYIGAGRANPTLPIIQGKVPLEVHIMADTVSQSYAEARFIVAAENGHSAYEGGNAWLHCGIANAGTIFGWWNSNVSAKARMDENGTKYFYTMTYAEAV